MAISPQQNNFMLLGASGLYLSNNNGTEWSEYGSGLGGAMWELKSSPADASVLYSQSSYHSLLVSTDNGKNWDNFGNVQLGRSLYFDKNGETVYIVYESGEDAIGITRDNGKTWEKIAFPVPEGYPQSIAGHPILTSRIFALYGRDDPAHIYYSDDLGLTWQTSTGMQSVSDPRLFFDHQQGDVVYVIGDLDVSRSTDAGATWNDCTRPNFPFWASKSDARAIIDPRDSNHIIIATRGNGIIISRDSCQTWIKSNDGLGSLFVSTITFDPNHPDTLYAATDGGAYVSFDFGQTWGQINDGLLGATVVYSIVVDKDSNVYAATPYGIFKLESK
jgi:photosystem II stability/assembly factor-like uncharacterized protein